MKKLFLAVLIGIVGLASRSKDDPGNQTQNLRWSRVDLTGANIWYFRKVRLVSPRGSVGCFQSGREREYDGCRILFYV